MLEGCRCCSAHHDIIVSSHLLDVANTVGAMVLADASLGGACQLAAGLINPLPHQGHAADDEGGPAGSKSGCCSTWHPTSKTK